MPTCHLARVLGSGFIFCCTVWPVVPVDSGPRPRRTLKLDSLGKWHYAPPSGRVQVPKPFAHTWHHLIGPLRGSLMSPSGCNGRGRMTNVNECPMPVGHELDEPSRLFWSDRWHNQAMPSKFPRLNIRWHAGLSERLFLGSPSWPLVNPLRKGMAIYSPFMHGLTKVA